MVAPGAATGMADWARGACHFGVVLTKAGRWAEGILSEGWAAPSPLCTLPPVLHPCLPHFTPCPSSGEATVKVQPTITPRVKAARGAHRTSQGSPSQPGHWRGTQNLTEQPQSAWPPAEAAARGPCPLRGTETRIKDAQPLLQPMLLSTGGTQTTSVTTHIKPAPVASSASVWAAHPPSNPTQPPAASRGPCPTTTVLSSLGFA